MLINVKTREIISEEDFRSLFPYVSFPTVITDGALKEYAFSCLYDNPPTPPPFKKVVRSGVVVLGGNYYVDYATIDMTDEEIQEYLDYNQKLLTEAVQKHLDDTVRPRNYDDIKSLCTYVTSKDPIFQKEGQAGVDWRDAVWRYCYDAGAAVRRGERSAPTIEELIAELPVFTWGD